MSLTILYAEDHAAVRLALKETLEREGWQVEACADGISALGRLEGGEGYALLVFDNDLPGVDGIELTRRASGGACARPRRYQDRSFKAGRQAASL